MFGRDKTDEEAVQRRHAHARQRPGMTICLIAVFSLLLAACVPAAAPAAIPVTEPTAAATAEPTAEPEATPTAEPTAEPTTEPAVTPTVEPTAMPTVASSEPTNTPEPDPTTAPVATATAAQAAPSSDEGEVEMEDFKFNPAVLTIRAGATVKFANKDEAQHTATSDTGVWDSGYLSKGEEFFFTFTEPGTYPYYCIPHGGPGGQGMSGTIIVVD